VPLLVIGPPLTSTPPSVAISTSLTPSAFASSILVSKFLIAPPSVVVSLISDSVLPAAIPAKGILTKADDFNAPLPKPTATLPASNVSLLIKVL
jgi:hypothetical protein